MKTWITSLVMVVSSSAALAGLAPDVVADAGSAVSPQELGRGNDGARARKQRVSLKCFQEGKLVLEVQGVTLADRHAAAIVLSSVDGGQTQVQLLDLRQGLCVIDARVP